MTKLVRVPATITMKLAGALLLLRAALLLHSGVCGYYCVGVRDAGSQGSLNLYTLGCAGTCLSMKDHLVFVFQIVAFAQL